MGIMTNPSGLPETEDFPGCGTFSVKIKRDPGKSGSLIIVQGSLLAMLCA